MGVRSTCKPISLTKGHDQGFAPKQATDGPGKALRIVRAPSNTVYSTYRTFCKRGTRIGTDVEYSVEKVLDYPHNRKSGRLYGIRQRTKPNPTKPPTFRDASTLFIFKYCTLSNLKFFFFVLLLRDRFNLCSSNDRLHLFSFPGQRGGHIRSSNQAGCGGPGATHIANVWLQWNVTVTLAGGQPRGVLICSLWSRENN